MSWHSEQKYDFYTIIVFFLHSSRKLNGLLLKFLNSVLKYVFIPEKIRNE